MNKFRFLWVVVIGWAVVTSSCVRLTPAGAQIQVLKDNYRERVSSCQLLGKVSVSSEDALRNAAADLSGDTAVMRVKDVAGSLYIRGTVYRCGLKPSSKKMIQEIVQPNLLENFTLPVDRQREPIQPEGNNKVMQKVAKCQSKGGRWIDDQCMVVIELD